jgi:ProP effector
MRAMSELPNGPVEPTEPAEADEVAQAAEHAEPAAPEAQAQPSAEPATAAAAPEANEAIAAAPELSPAQTGAKLKELFPALFTAIPVLPLKLRIQADIQARAPGVFTKKGLSIFLHRYTTGTPYLQGLAQAPQRYDLDGAPAGEIAAEHRDAAVAELKQRREASAARRAAEQALRPPRPARPGSTARPQGEEPNLPAQGTAEHPNGASARPAPRPPRAPKAQNRPQSQRPSGPRPDQRPPRPHRQQPPPHARPPLPPQAAAEAAHAAAPREPEDPARRERALLLRAYESSTISRANFCALKRIGEAELEAALTLARQERGAR